jgi:hypothetical protein
MQNLVLHLEARYVSAPCACVPAIRSNDKPERRSASTVDRTLFASLPSSIRHMACLRYDDTLSRVNVRWLTVRTLWHRCGQTADEQLCAACVPQGPFSVQRYSQQYALMASTPCVELFGRVQVLAIAREDEARVFAQVRAGLALVGRQRARPRVERPQPHHANPGRCKLIPVGRAALEVFLAPAPRNARDLAVQTTDVRPALLGRRSMERDGTGTK